MNEIFDSEYTESMRRIALNKRREALLNELDDLERKIQIMVAS